MSPENPKHKNIFLVGFMGAGKTTVGRILARMLGYKYVDADEVVEERTGKAITEIFSEQGEDFFRDLETRAIRFITERSGQVVATGGGAVMREENRNLMEAGGVTVYLKTPAHVIWDRVKESESRPLLQVEDPYGTIERLLKERTPAYESACITVETESLSPEEVAAQIIGKLDPD